MPPDFFGPVGQRGLRLAIESVVRDPEHRADLADVVRIFDPDDADTFRKDLLRRVGDPELTRAIYSEVVPMLRSKDAGNTVLFFTGKLEPLCSSPFLSRVFGGTDALPVGEVVEHGRSLVVHAPSSTLGEEGSRLAVGYVLHRLWLEARRRPASAPVHIFCDEWQRYRVPSVPAMLAEGRKYGLWLRLANQNFAQLDQVTRDTVLANVGALVAFRTGPADAAVLDVVFPTVPIRRLLGLSRHQVAVCIEGDDFVTPAPGPLPGGDVRHLRAIHRAALGQLPFEEAEYEADPDCRRTGPKAGRRRK